MKRSTIQDVATDAGVSVTSVSNYLNRRFNHLRPETKERIKQSIEKLKYAPSKVARQLKTGHSPVLGVLVPSIVNPYHSELAFALDEAAYQRGFRLIIGNGHRDGVRERDFFDELISYGVRGFIITAELSNLAILKDYVRRGIAFVFFDLRASELGIDGIDFVSIDNESATSNAVVHLYSLGHRAIAYVTPAMSSANRKARCHGFQSAIKRLRLGEPVVIQNDSSQVADQKDANLAFFGQRAAEKLLRCAPIPTAVVTMNDIMAIGVLAGLHKNGRTIPDDMSLIGIDDIQLSSLVVPTLTTLRPNYQEMAGNAIDCISSRLLDPEIVGREYLFSPELIVRESTTAPKR